MDRSVVGPDRHHDHSKGEAEEIQDDTAGKNGLADYYTIKEVLLLRGKTHSGTAGVMFDFSPAGGLAPTESSLSRIVFSDATILLVAMVESSFQCGMEAYRWCWLVKGAPLSKQVVVDMEQTYAC